MTVAIDTVARPPACAISRAQVRDFYDDYYDTLDDVRLEEWPDLFIEHCTYRVISRENYERGLRLATIGAESRGMLRDRAAALLHTQVYAPRYYRRFPGPLRIAPADGEGASASHNLLIVQTLIDQKSEIVLVGRCRDRLVVEDGRVLLASRDVIFDSEMIANSLIYPA